MPIEPQPAPAGGLARARVGRRAAVGYGVWALALVWFGAEVATGPVMAQAPGQPVLSSPIATSPGGPGADGQLPAGALPPLGQGAGQHSPNSPFAPLPARNDVVPWSTLTSVKMKTVGRRLLPEFPANVRALHGTTVRVQGFMMPLAPGEKQTHFLVSSVPLTCSFCTPGGPESMLEVRTRTPVKYSLEAVVVEGRMQVLDDDPMGLFYRMTFAVPVK